MSPKDENELQHMLKTALNQPGPVVIRYPRGSGTGTPLDTELRLLPIAKGEILREGKDLTIVAIGTLVQNALEAADILEKEGLSAGVVNARFVKPLDKEFYKSIAAKTPLLVTLEENSIVGGFGGAVREILDGTNTVIRSIALPDSFVEHGAMRKLYEKVGLTPAQIASKVQEFHKQRVATA